MLPGLINAHDHLEFNLFPQLGRGPYPNAAEWARDIYHPERSPIREQLRVPKPVRLWWGALKNLLSGVTTVCHHNPYEPAVFDADFPVRVVRRFSWAHSLAFEPDLAARFRKAPPAARSWFTAAKAPTPRRAASCKRWTRWAPSDRRTAIIHGVALDRAGVDLMRRRRASLIWCPTSNLAMLGRTVSRAVLRSGIPIALATDSALSAPVDLLDELAVARRYLPAARLYEMVTHDAGPDSAPAGIRTGRTTGSRSARALFGGSVAMVVVRGRIRLLVPNWRASFPRRAPRAPAAPHRRPPARAGRGRCPRAPPRRGQASRQRPPARRQADSSA